MKSGIPPVELPTHSRSGIQGVEFRSSCGVDVAFLSFYTVCIYIHTDRQHAQAVRLGGLAPACPITLEQSSLAEVDILIIRDHVSWSSEYTRTYIYMPSCAIGCFC